MGPVTHLIDLVAQLASLDPEATIYVAEPWACDSPAIVDKEPPTGGLPDAAMRQGLKYFLEVFVARDFLDDWESSLDKTPTDQARCDRLIRYAVNDA
jgi:hypothetical protein